MKKLLLLFIAVFCLSNVKAQYNFTNTSGTYTPITGGTDATSGTSWDDDEFSIPIGFTFYAYGKGYDYAVVESNGSLFLHNGLSGGSIYSYPDTIPGIAGNAEDLVDYGSSSILYKVTGTAGSRIFTVEFLNAGFYWGATSEYVNFQIRLFEGTGTIEVHYGTSSIPTNTYYPMVGISQINFMTGYQGNSQFLSGLPASPTVVNYETYLDEMPSNGRLYRFTDITLGINDQEEASEIRFYPNPARDVVNFDIPAGQGGMISLLDVTGKEISQIKVAAGKSTLNLPALSPGVYLVKLPGGTTKRLVIQ